MATYQILYWHDIPVQVRAKDVGGRAGAELPARFQEAIDQAAMAAGLIGSDEYTEQMRMDKRACGDDLEAEVESARVALEAEWTDEVLRAAIRAGGYRDRAPA